MSLLKVENVALSFGNRQILKGINLEVEPGTIIALSGKSGSGKTTLFGIMSGLLKPDSGRVLYQDRDIYKWNDFRRSRYRNREIGYVFQTFNLLPDLNVYRNIVFPTVLNWRARRVGQTVDYLIQYLDLQKIVKQYPATLSGGEKQRVSIARAIINSPRIILADEPTGNLDRLNGDRIFALFEEIRDQRNISVIIATHDDFIIRSSDIHYHLEDGVLTVQRTRRSVEAIEAIEIEKDITRKIRNKKKSATTTGKKTAASKTSKNSASRSAGAKKKRK